MKPSDFQIHLNSATTASHQLLQLLLLLLLLLLLHSKRTQLLLFLLQVAAAASTTFRQTAKTSSSGPSIPPPPLPPTPTPTPASGRLCCTNYKDPPAEDSVDVFGRKARNSHEGTATPRYLDTFLQVRLGFHGILSLYLREKSWFSTLWVQFYHFPFRSKLIPWSTWSPQLALDISKTPPPLFCRLLFQNCYNKLTK